MSFKAFVIFSIFTISLGASARKFREERFTEKYQKMTRLYEKAYFEEYESDSEESTKKFAKAKDSYREGKKAFKELEKIKASFKKALKITSRDQQRFLKEKDKKRSRQIELQKEIDKLNIFIEDTPRVTFGAGFKENKRRRALVKPIRKRLRKKKKELKKLSKKIKKISTETADLSLTIANFSSQYTSLEKDIEKQKKKVKKMRTRRNRLRQEKHSESAKNLIDRKAQERDSAEMAYLEVLDDLDEKGEIAQHMLMDLEVLRVQGNLSEVQIKVLEDEVDQRIQNTFIGEYIEKSLAAQEKKMNDKFMELAKKSCDIQKACLTQGPQALKEVTDKILAAPKASCEGFECSSD